MKDPLEYRVLSRLSKAKERSSRLVGRPIKKKTCKAKHRGVKKEQGEGKKRAPKNYGT